MNVHVQRRRLLTDLEVHVQSVHFQAGSGQLVDLEVCHDGGVLGGGRATGELDLNNTRSHTSLPTVKLI